MQVCRYPISPTWPLKWTGGASMKHIMQTRRTNCGQACGAMLLGVDIGAAEDQIGTRGMTSTVHRRDTLKSAGRVIGGTRRVCVHPWEDAVGNSRVDLLLFVKIPDKAGPANHWALWDSKKRGVLDTAFNSDGYAPADTGIQVSQGFPDYVRPVQAQEESGLSARIGMALVI